VCSKATLAVPVINTLEAVTLANVGLNPFAILEANDADTACDAEIATLALSAFTTLLTVRANVEPSPLVKVVVALLIDAVVSNEPVFVGVTFKANDAVTAFCACEALTAYEALTATLALLAFTTLFIVKGNVVSSPLVNVIVAFVLDAVKTLFNANDAVEANDELVVVFDVVANDAEIAFCASEADVANDELIACEADTACEAEVANDELIAVVANDAETATLALSAFTTLLAVILNVEPSPLVKVVVALLIDALTLFITLVNVFPSPLVNVIVSLLLDAVRTLFNANDAVEANDELVVVFDVEANDAEIAFCAKDALVANDAEIAVVAVSALPVKLPTKVVAFILVAANVFVKGT